MRGAAAECGDTLNFEKVMKKAQNLWASKDFVLIMAPAGGFEPLAYRLGVASIHCSSVTVKRGKPLILLDFTIVTLLVMYGFFLLIFIVFCGRN